MWNYSFMFPSILILFILLVFYFARPRLPIRMNRTYFAILLFEMSVMVADIVSSRADENYQMHSPAMLYVLNTLFFVLYVSRTYLFFRFTVDALMINPKQRPALFRALLLPFVIAEALCVSSFATGAVFRIEDGAYRSGPLYNVLYVCFLFYIFASIVFLVIYRDRLKPNRFYCGTGYNLLLLAGNLMRFFFPRLLVMPTFCLAAVLVIYLAFQNPDLYLSDRGDAFNMRGLRALLNDYYHRKDYAILGFSILNYSQERSILGGRQTDECIEQISRFLIESHSRCLPFYLRNGRFALIIPATVRPQQVRDAIEQRFRQPWSTMQAEVYLNVDFLVLVPNPRLDSADRIVNNMNVAFESSGKAGGASAAEDAVGLQTMQQLDEQVDILRSIENALDQDKVEVYLQPVFSSRTRRIVAAEALARIRDVGGNVISPALFIPIAEKTGYINRLGDMVFEKTCAFIHDHDIAGLGLTWINVNLSPVQCMQSDLCQRFNATLRRYGVSADLIHLEITEQSITDYALLEKQIEAMRKQGFQFVLDDYGSGYSNLTRVKHYPFVNIKLDMEVVWDYCRERDSLLPTIVEGFGKMGFSITAEGIETEQMADLMTAAGCEYLQGYLFDRPLEMDEFVMKYGG